MSKEKKDFNESIKKLAEEAFVKKQEGYVPESNNNGVPKNFFIRCPSCRWARSSSGTKDDLSDLTEVTPGCRTCGKWRKFKCPNCGTSSTMQRIKGN